MPISGRRSGYLSPELVDSLLRPWTIVPPRPAGSNGRVIQGCIARFLALLNGAATASPLHNPVIAKGTADTYGAFEKHS